MRIFLDGEVYEIKAGTKVEIQPIEDWPESSRFDAQQYRKDRREVSSFTLDSHRNGLGIQVQNTALAAHAARLWDVENIDTRLDGQMLLSPQLFDSSIVPSRGDLGIPVVYKNELYFVTTNHPGGSMAGVDDDQPGWWYRYDPATEQIGSYRRMIPSNSLGNIGSIHGLFVRGDEAFFVYRANNEHRWTFVQMPDAAGGNKDNLPGLLGSYTGNFPYPWRAIELAGTTHLLGYDSVQDAHLFAMVQAAGTANSFVGSAPGLAGSYVAPLRTDGVTAYAALPDGIWDFDDTPNKLVDAGRSLERNPAQVMLSNKLYFKNDLSLLEYGTTISSVGYDRDAGLPADKMGEITAMTSTFDKAYVAVKGGTYTHILTKDVAHVWQYYARVPTAGLWVKDMFFSDAPDGLDRLWLEYGNHSIPGFFLNPVVNPLQAGTYSHVPTGHATWPDFDGGMAEEPGAFFDWATTMDAVGSNTGIVQYAVDGTTGFATLGVIGTGQARFLFGSPAGIEAHRLQARVILSRDSAQVGTTPVLRQQNLHYLKIPAKRDQFFATIDVDKTANAIRPAAAVIGSLRYLRDKRTLSPFNYGQVATTWVRLLGMAAEEETPNRSVLETERGGTWKIKLSEIVL